MSQSGAQNVTGLIDKQSVTLGENPNNLPLGDRKTQGLQ